MSKKRRKTATPPNFDKVIRVSQGHLEVGLYRWRAIMAQYPRVEFISQLPEQYLDAIIAEME